VSFGVEGTGILGKVIITELPGGGGVNIPKPAGNLPAYSGGNLNAPWAVLGLYKKSS